MSYQPFNSNSYSNSLDELRLTAAPAQDRLPAMLFLAALIHGVLIIGITFNPSMLEPFGEAISLEVTIVADPDQHIDRPDEAEYLAQASQQGGGNTQEQVRPAAPLQSPVAVDNFGDRDGNAVADATGDRPPADQVLTTRTRQQRQVGDAPRSQPQPEVSTAIALESGSEITLPLPQDERATMMIHDNDPRQLLISADTRESEVAAYLDNWKRRVEAAGDAYFPELDGLAGHTGSPTLEVLIDASGQLAEVVIRQSSGSRLLDQAALDILRRAGPFDPFPAEIRADYDSLRFAYKWLFSEQPAPATASVTQS